uniref:Chorein N-terminal domain-containing protein n=2 Tax=Clytia hemisphaerica TaxID=252671 RepID=A0A7M5X1J9_9CNID
MVLRSLVTSLLNKYLGKYVKDIDSENLTIGLWSGKVSLSELELREEALVELDLPIDVNGGYIGQLSVSIPWTSIYVNPVEIEIDEVFILTGPSVEKPYNEEKEKRKSNAAKQNQIKALEKSKSISEKTESPENGTAADDTLAEKLQAQILKNLQVRIKNIHVRYEDKTTIPGQPFSVGAMLYSVTSETTTANWIPTIIDGSVRKFYKMVNLDSLSLYWNSNTQFSMTSNENWKALMKSQVTNQSSKTHIDYILEPLSLAVHMEVDQDARVSMEYPKFLMQVILKELTLSLSKEQFNGIMKLLDSFMLMEVNQIYRKYKPLKTVKEDPKAWWQYILKSYTETSYKQWTWEYMKSHRELYKKYVKLYYQKLCLGFQKNPDPNHLAVIKKLIKEQEENLDVINILIARNQATNEFESKKEDIAAEKSEVGGEPQGWLEWLGITGSGSETNITQDKEGLDLFSDEESAFSLGKLSDTEKEELYKAIGYLEEKNHPTYSKSYVRAKLKLTLDTCYINILKSEREKISFNLKKLIAIATERPGSDGLGLALQIEDVGAVQSVHREEINIVEPHARNDPNLLVCDFQINPVDVKAYYAAQIKSQPLDVYFHKKTVDILADVFTVEDDQKIMMEMQRAATETVAELRNASRAGIEYTIMNNKALYLDFNMKSPTVIFPLKYADESNEEAVRIYFGDLVVKTELESELQEQLLNEVTESDLEILFYHHTDITVSNIHMAVSRLEEGSRLRVNENTDEKNYIIPPIGFNLDVYRCLKQGYANFPDFRISGEIPSITINLTEDYIVYLYQLMTYITSQEVPIICNNIDLQSTTSISKNKTTSTISELTAIQDLLMQSAKPLKERLQTHQNEETNHEVGYDTVDGGLPMGESNYDSAMSTFNRTKLDSTFTISQIEVVYMMEDRKEFLFHINTIGCDVIMHMWDLNVNARVKYFDFVAAVSSNDLIVQSITSEDLISFSLTQADASGPEFNTTFNQTELSSSVDCSGFNFYLQDKSLTTLLKTIDKINRRLPTLEELDVPSKQPTKADLLANESMSLKKNVLGTIIEYHDDDEEDLDDLDVEAKKSMTELERKVMDKIDFLLNFKLKKVNVILEANNKQLCQIIVEDLHSDVKTRSKSTEIDASLIKIKMIDKDPGTLYPEIFHEESENVIKAKIVMYNEIARLDLQPDMDVDITFCKMKIVCNLDFFCAIYKMILDITSPMNSKIIPEQSQIEKKKEVANTEFTKMSLKLSLDAPYIIYPLQCKYQDHLLIDLGHLNLTNELKMTEDDILYDTMHVELTDVKIESALEDHCDFILAPFAMQSSISRSLNAELYSMDIGIILQEAKVRLVPIDVSFTVDLINALMKSLLLFETVGLQGEEPPALQDYVFHLKAEIAKFIIEGFDSNDEENCLIRIVSEAFNCDYHQYKDMTVKIGLQNISIIEERTKDSSGKIITVLTSESENEIAHVNHLMKENGDQQLTVRFAKLNFCAHELAVSNTVDFIKDILERIYALDSLQPVPEQVDGEGQPLSNKFELDCSLDELSIWWTLYRETFASVNMHGLNLVLETTPTVTKVKTKLRNLSVLDLRQNCIYPKIMAMAVTDKNLLSCEFTMQVESDFTTYTVWLRMGRVEMVILYKFITEFMESMKPWLKLLAPTEDDDLTVRKIPDIETTSITSSQRKPELQKEAPVVLIDLDIDITAPLVYVPESSTSKRCIAFDLGRMVVSNNFTKSTDGNSDDLMGVDLIKANLKDVEVFVDMDIDNPKKRHRISKDLSSNLEISRTIYRKSNDIEVKVVSRILPVVVSEPNHHLL